MQSIINRKLNLGRFSTICSTVLKEYVNQWFDLEIESPYMLLVSKIKKNKLLTVNEDKFIGLEKLKLKRSIIPAVTHVNNTARIQTVDSDINSLFYKLISSFNDISGCPILINTSFNVKDEPMVCDPKDAINCFLRTNLDYLVLGNFLLRK